MVSWEAQADRGRRPPSRGRGQRSAHTPKPAPSREKTPTKEAAPETAPAPRGSPIARKLARHASSWTTLTVPQLAVQVSCPYLPYPNCLSTALSFSARVQSSVRPRPGTATSHRRSLKPRAGSAAYWAPCLTAPPTGGRLKPGFQPRHVRTVLWTRVPTGISPRTQTPISSFKRDIPLRPYVAAPFPSIRHT